MVFLNALLQVLTRAWLAEIFSNGPLFYVCCYMIGSDVGHKGPNAALRTP